MTEDLQNLQTLLEQLKASCQDVSPHDSDPAPEILDGIRAHGPAAVEPLRQFMVNIVETNWDFDPDEATDNEENAWNYAYVYGVQLLADLPITAQVVATLFDLIERYLDDE
ncbi:MAG: hypothetical protein JXA10_04665 [Anaerolineae bacterium]|nr:hypothetical protein [Anaerolineae bacterium]